MEQETELRAFVPDAGRGRRTVDALLQVTKISGDPGLIHIEVQSQNAAHFEERIFLYFSRLRDKKFRPVCSLAILGDTSPKWRPRALSLDFWRCTLDFRFSIAKLLDYPDTPEQPLNPFSWLVAAHRQAQRTRGNSRQRTEAKLCLVKGLYEHGFSPEIVRELFNLMDWVLVLRGKFDHDFTRSLAEFEEERKMVYINSVERYHRKIGREDASCDPASHRYGSQLALGRRAAGQTAGS